MTTRKAFAQIAEILLTGGKKATKYFSEREVLKGTRITFKRARGKQSRTGLLFTVGVPNYAERQFIKKAKKAGEPFPIKKIQIRWPK